VLRWFDGGEEKAERERGLAARGGEKKMGDARVWRGIKRGGGRAGGAVVEGMVRGDVGHGGSRLLRGSSRKTTTRCCKERYYDQVGNYSDALRVSYLMYI
jgi:hypothetical protein